MRVKKQEVIKEDNSIKQDDLFVISDRYEEFNKTYGYRRFNPLYLYLFATFFTVIWFAIIFVYFSHSNYNFASLFKMMPHELGGFVSGIIVPILVVWIITLYIDKNINSNYEKKVIYPFLQSIIDPHGDTSVITSVVTEKIKTETEELKTIIIKFQEFADRLNEIHNNLENKVTISTNAMKNHEQSLSLIDTNLNNTSKIIKDKVDDILKNLSSNITILNDTANKAEITTSNIAGNLLHETKDLETHINTTATIVENISKIIDTNIENIKNVTNISNSTIQETKETFSNIIKSFNESLEVLETRIHQILYNVSQGTNDIISKSNTSAERIGLTVSSLKTNVFDIENIVKANEKINISLKDEFSKQTEYVIDSIKTEITKLNNFTNDIVTVISGVEGKFIGVDDNFTNIKNNITQKFQELLTDIIKEKDSIYNTADEIIGKTNNITNSFKEQKDELIYSFKEIQENAITSSDNIVKSVDKITSTNDNIKNSTSDTNKVVKNITEELAKYATLILNVSKKVEQDLNIKINELEDTALRIETSGKIGETSIDAQINKIATVAETSIINMGKLKDNIEQTYDTVNTMVKNLDENVTNINNGVIQKTDTAIKIMNDGIEKNLKHCNDFYMQTQSFKTESVKTEQMFKTFLTSIQNEIRQLSNISNMSQELFDNINISMSTSSYKVPEILNNIKNIDTAITTTNSNFKENIDKIKLNINDVIDAITVIDNTFTEFIKNKTSEMNYLSNTSKENISEVAKTTNQLNNEVKDLIENFKDSYKDLKSLNTSVKVTKPMLQETLNLFENQNYIYDNKDDLTDKLNSVLVDIVRIVLPNDITSLSNEYQKGNKDVFRNAFLKNLSNKELNESINDNDEVFEFIDKYILIFENYLKLLKNNKNREIEMKNILSNDIGKIYLLLKNMN